jgi:type II secretory pathway component GspD/PulD (secretin)
VDKGGNRLVCFTSPRVINEIERIVKSIDHPHILVMLDTRIVEVSLDKTTQYGINWATLLPVSGGLTAGESPLKSGYPLGTWSLKPLNFDTKLDLLIQNNDARLLMNSKLTTSNNREASLQIGDVIPYQIQSYNLGSSGGSGANMQIQKENVGVMLTMTPHINENNQVTLQLTPEISNIVGFIGPNKDLPQTRVRKATTTVRVEDGQTILLAGLLSDENSTIVSKIPVLGDIPLLGRLFQSRSEHLVKKNLILEITPHILRDSSTVEMKTGDAREPAPAPAGQQNQIDLVPEQQKQ